MISAMNIHIKPMTNSAVIGGDFHWKTKTPQVCTAIAFECDVRITDYEMLRSTCERPVKRYINNLNKMNNLTKAHVRATPTSPVCFSTPGGDKESVNNVDTQYT
jgi:hypothetical protein